MLDNLQLFVLIVERGGMAAAGRELGYSPATVSARVVALEEHFGVRLLNRTTRSLSLTAEGRALFEGAQQVLAQMQALDGRVRMGADMLVGGIRVSAPVDLGRQWLVPLLDAFLEAHPALEVDLHLSDSFVDLNSCGYDVAVRYGALQDSSLRVRQLATVRRLVVASPEYLRRAGTPTTPEALSEHQCLLMRFGDDSERRWPFVVDGAQVDQAVGGARTSNDGELVRRWCVAGLGIARKSEPDVVEELRSGRLVRLLEPYEAPPVALQLISPGGQPPARRVRLFMDHLIASKVPSLT